MSKYSGRSYIALIHNRIIFCNRNSDSLVTERFLFQTMFDAEHNAIGVEMRHKIPYSSPRRTEERGFYNVAMCAYVDGTGIYRVAELEVFRWALINKITALILQHFIVSKIVYGKDDIHNRRSTRYLKRKPFYVVPPLNSAKDFGEVLLNKYNRS